MLCVISLPGMARIRHNVGRTPTRSNTTNSSLCHRQQQIIRCEQQPQGRYTFTTHLTSPAKFSSGEPELIEILLASKAMI